MLVEMQAEGAPGDVVPAFTALGNRTTERGWTVRVENPADLATGSGRFEIELPDVDEEKDARAVLQALIDQIPGGADVFTFQLG
jgi:hypothetical protein